MTFDAMISSLTNNALDTLRDFDRQQALDAGFSSATVYNWQRVHRAYYGQTTSKSKQRVAGEIARRRGVSVDKLAFIERSIAKVRNARSRNNLRIKLLQAIGDYTAVTRLAKKILPGADKPPQKRVTISAVRHGRRTMIITADARDITDLESALMHDVDREQPLAPQLLERFLALIRSGGRVPYAVPRPLLLVGLDQHTTITSGNGDEVILGLTDGTTMTGADYLNTVLATADNDLEAALFHPSRGAVNLYRSERFANQKQRDLARATMPICASPDCHRSADLCEIHHVTAWKNGGETNVGNLAPLCSYHNRVNDDDARMARRGRIEMRDGTPTWISPRGYARQNTQHPYGAMRTLFGVTPATR